MAVCICTYALEKNHTPSSAVSHAAADQGELHLSGSPHPAAELHKYKSNVDCGWPCICPKPQNFQNAMLCPCSALINTGLRCYNCRVLLSAATHSGAVGRIPKCGLGPSGSGPLKILELRWEQRHRRRKSTSSEAILCPMHLHRHAHADIFRLVRNSSSQTSTKASLLHHFSFHL